MQFLLVFVLLSCTVLCDSYQILLAVPVTSKSLHLLFSSLGIALADSGNEVTLLTPYAESVQHSKVHPLQLTRDPPYMYELNPFESTSLIESMNIVYRMANETATIMWTDPRVWNMWERRHDFDAIIMPLYLNEIATPFLMDYKGVLVIFCTPGIEYTAMSYLGNWLSPAAVSSFTQPFDDKMSFLERALNAAMVLYERAAFSWYFIPLMRTVTERYFPDIGDVSRFCWQNSLTLINGHFALDAPVPLLPNQVEVGTINARASQPLPKDLADFVEGSGDAGVIYFCLGSFVRGEKMPQDKKKAFLEAFRRLPQGVIWKYELDDLDLPPNVLTRKWLPQQDILGHPKTRIFISHCGNLASQEAKYHGVPVLAVPVLFDQPRNAKRLVRRGLALILNWDEITPESIIEAVETLINDTSYRERMQNISRILKDQKEPAGERAAWWVEYAIRHKDSKHLEYAGSRLHFLQYILLDVLLFFAVTVAVLVIITSKLLKLVFRGRGKEKKD